MPRQRSKEIEMSERGVNLPPEQEAIRAKCFHPTGTFVEFPIEDVETSIPERFEKIVRMYPDRIAVEVDDERLTFEALNRAANRLANVILDSRDEDKTPIAVVLPRGVAQSVAILAVLKAGKTLLLLDPRSSADESAHFLADSQAKLIITSKDNESGLRDWEKKGLRLIDIDILNYGRSDQNPGVRVGPDAGAYIKYTSGSTGEAKGAVITQRSVLHGVMTYTNSSYICAEDRLVRVGGNSINRIFFTNLLNGATLCPLDLRQIGIHQLAAWLIKHEISIYRSFPSAFRAFVSTLSGQEQFSRLRLIRLAGEPLYRRDVELYKKYFPKTCLLINSYSSTETGNICFYYLNASSEIGGPHVPVGYPVRGKEVSIVDDLGDELPANHPGEIVVKSRFLSAGYWQRTEETRNSFQSAFEDSKARIYHTGDIGLLSAEGCLTHLGRKDDRVKIRNFRVDIGEVEAMLAEHPEVNLACVTAKADVFGDTRLIAYFVPRNKSGLTVSGLREFLGAKLPRYMVPSVFVAMAELPLTRTGKVNRRALPDPGKSRPNLATPLAEPTTEVERKLAAIWMQVLAIDQVGIHDIFFDLGGHSLTAHRVIARVIQTFQLELPVKALFDAPTVSAMAAIITQSQTKYASDEDLAQMLREVEVMTEEEAQRQLAKATAQN
jgi:amino acid adenylation domain-containing protein